MRPCMLSLVGKILSEIKSSSPPRPRWLLQHAQIKRGGEEPSERDQCFLGRLWDSHGFLPVSSSAEATAHHELPLAMVQHPLLAIHIMMEFAVGHPYLATNTSPNSIEEMEMVGE